ncbi:MAG: hypothetical protein JNL05_02985 [Flavobacteriales bacterium]|nr:hypothetical protein [Flavobacteriales bacterium]
MRRLLLLSMFLLGTGLAAQDRILLMNGQEIQGRVLGQSTLEIRFMLDVKGKQRLEKEPTESVFSVTDSTGKETVWYFHDPAFGNELTVDQMRWYIKGEQDARIGYKPTLPKLGGFLLGAGLVIGLDLETNSLLIPPAYAGLMAWPRVHVTPGSVRDPLMEGDNHYAMGYSAVGRPKRVVHSLWSTAAGVAVGLLVRQLIINPAQEP